MTLKPESAHEAFNESTSFDIKLDNVSVVASSVQILNEVSLEVKKGEMVAVLGQSGAGKSTLLRTIAGLIKPAKNTVLFNNSDFFSLNKKDRLRLRRMIGYVPQQFKLIKESSVFENVMIGRLGHLSTAVTLLRRYPQKDQKIVLNCISRVGLAGKEGMAAKKLSGGEQQRVAIARCLAQEPQVILADEPMASLDFSLAESMLEILNNENKKGKTVVFVVHDIGMACRYAKRVILMEKSRILYDMPADEIDENAIKSFFD